MFTVLSKTLCIVVKPSGPLLQMDGRGQVDKPVDRMARRPRAACRKTAGKKPVFMQDE